MTLLSLLVDKVGPGVINTPQELCHPRIEPTIRFLIRQGLSNFVTYSTMKNALTVNKKKLMTVMTSSDLVFQ